MAGSHWIYMYIYICTATTRSCQKATPLLHPHPPGPSTDWRQKIMGMRRKEHVTGGEKKKKKFVLYPSPFKLPICMQMKIPTVVWEEHRNCSSPWWKHLNLDYFLTLPSNGSQAHKWRNWERQWRSRHFHLDECACFPLGSNLLMRKFEISLEGQVRWSISSLEWCWHVFKLFVLIIQPFSLILTDSSRDYITKIISMNLAGYWRVSYFSKVSEFSKLTRLASSRSNDPKSRKTNKSRKFLRNEWVGSAWLIMLSGSGLVFWFAFVETLLNLHADKKMTDWYASHFVTCREYWSRMFCVAWAESWLITSLSQSGQARQGADKFA